MGLTYAGAGVDLSELDAGRRAVGRALARSRRGRGVVHGFGHYAGIVRAGGAQIAVHTDGVGTKAAVARDEGSYSTIGVDCVAMNANDIACVGARPAAFVDYIAASRADPRIFAEIARGLARGAREAGVPVVGGETAVMPGLFAGRGFSFDLAGTIVGTVPAGGPLLGRAVRDGDVIVGARSSGLHSNGYSLARRALRRFSLDERPRGVGRLGSALLRPTRVYVRPALDAIASCEVHGVAHVTGGSFTKLPRLRRAGYVIDSLPREPPIMRLIREQGVPDAEMYRTFNMGVGMCVVAPPGEESGVRRAFARRGVRADVVGRVGGRPGVTVAGVRVA